ncbi:MAG TPA: neutral zinc metallopeptidase [Syntrophomonadaceae bacterium]|jgi:predicted metalloprotease|nr:neutral zinc metallopeptidase [Syntrophomonadaceae bacterium]
MEWKGRRASSNVEDRRGSRAKGLVGGGIGTIILVVLYALLGGDPSAIIGNLQSNNSQISTPYQETAQEQELREFASVVLAETEDVWTALFRQQGARYVEPTLVLYTDTVTSACGTAASSAGPFYCPGDQKVYLDLSFYNDLQTQFQAPGDMAMAYVIAHEVGHHVQYQMGTLQEVQSLRGRVSQTQYNQYSVRLELQADYYAGVWAHYAERTNLLEPGDIEEALNAASAVGDDRIQKKYQGEVEPDTFTHGTSEQRQRWFMKGYQTGTLEGGDTFSARTL